MQIDAEHGPGDVWDMAPESTLVPAPQPPADDPQNSGVVDFLLRLVTEIPRSNEPSALDPKARCATIIRDAAWRAAGTSGALALPPGPLGLATILPDLMAIWRIQQQMVADIAKAHGKEAVLTREVMIYCLFRHGAALLVRDLVIRAGERYLVRRVTLKVFQQVLQKIGIATTQRALGRIASRWVPILGALAVAAYARWDTQQVGQTALETFGGPLELEDDSTEPTTGDCPPLLPPPSES